MVEMDSATNGGLSLGGGNGVVDRHTGQQDPRSVESQNTSQSGMN